MDLTVLNQAMAAAGAVSVERDPFFNQTTLLLHGDGTNGAQNQTFLDSSTNNFTITRNGNTTQGSFSPFSKPDGRWSNFFDGGGDNLSGIGTTSDFNFIHNTSGLCTIECWVYWTGVAGTSDVILANRRNSAEIGVILAYSGSSGKWLFEIAKGSTGNFVVSASTTANAVANQWVHLCAEWDYVSDSGTWYINGVVDSTFSRINTATTSNATDSLYIGRNKFDTNLMWQGYISNLRISNSIVYGGAFTPSTEPLTTTSQSATNVELLTCQSNRFIDNSSNGYSETANGDVKVTPFSPFPITTEYSPSVNGGSGYFDGADDTLTLANDTALSPESGDFTIEAWFYPTAALGTYEPIWTGSGTNTPLFGKVTNGYGLRVGGVADVISATAPAINQWVHIAVSRSGTDLRVFINGNLENTVTNSTTFTTASASYAIGTTTNDLEGFVSDVRFVKGSALYTASFPIPTAPLTAVSGTQFLCNFTNAGIYDNTGFNNLETVGNAQIDTTTKKYGTGSLNSDGTGDSLYIANAEMAFGTGDFTLEFWFYEPSGVSGNGGIFDTRSATTNADGFLIQRIDTKALRIYVTAAVITSPGNTIVQDTWQFIVVTRQSGTMRLYVDGVQINSTADATNMTNKSCTIFNNVIRAQSLEGFLDDMRVTKGICRYPDGTTFTPPDAPFLDQ